MDAKAFELWCGRAQEALAVIDQGWVPAGQRRARVARLAAPGELAAAIATLQAEFPRADRQTAGVMHGLLQDLLRVAAFLSDEAEDADMNGEALEILRELRGNVATGSRLDAAEQRLGYLERWSVAHLQDSMANHTRAVRNEVLRLVALLLLIIGGAGLLLAEGQHVFGGAGLVVAWLLLGAITATLLVLSFLNGYDWHKVDKYDN